MGTLLGTTKPANHLRVHIRWMIRRDMAEVLEIENESYESPWREDDFIHFLRQRNVIGMVAEHSERVVGFDLYEVHKHRLHLLNIAVASDMLHRGVGTQMIEHLARKLSADKRNRLTLEVRETNLPAQLFYRSCGFKAVGLIRGYYEESPEDAYVMELKYCEVQE